MANPEASSLCQTGEIILEEWRLDLNINRQMADLFVHDPPKADVYKKRAEYLEDIVRCGIIFQAQLIKSKPSK